MSFWTVQTHPDTSIVFQGWRWSFYTSGMFGVLLGVLIYFTIQEPKRQPKQDSTDEADIRELVGGDKANWWRKAMVMCHYFCKPTIIIFCLAGSFRKAGTLDQSISIYHVSYTPISDMYTITMHWQTKQTRHIQITVKFICELLQQHLPTVKIWENMSMVSSSR